MGFCESTRGGAPKGEVEEEVFNPALREAGDDVGYGLLCGLAPQIRGGYSIHPSRAIPRFLGRSNTGRQLVRSAIDENGDLEHEA
jgi:hypothetical protein